MDQPASQKGGWAARLAAGLFPGLPPRSLPLGFGVGRRRAARCLPARRKNKNTCSAASLLDMAACVRRPHPPETRKQLQIKSTERKSQKQEPKGKTARINPNNTNGRSALVGRRPKPRRLGHCRKSGRQKLLATRGTRPTPRGRPSLTVLWYQVGDAWSRSYRSGGVPPPSAHLANRPRLQKSPTYTELNWCLPPGQSDGRAPPTSIEWTPR